jgi:hypothetical protein
LRPHCSALAKAAQVASHLFPPWYNSHFWKKRARRELKAEPLCAVCLEAGHVTAATVADHCPRWTNWAEFIAGPLRSVCHEHNMVGQFRHRPYRLDVDPRTGWPTDLRHPANTGKLV